MPLAQDPTPAAARPATPLLPTSSALRNALRFPAEGVYIAVLANSDTQEPDIQTLAARRIAALVLPK
ncbi:hypothetical protein [Roseateles oligotrophus]|uniref:Uncharacterized protein n=1 Tax=Roseateles oligotrophus TaxID=1769250 RepID=A0ABT2YLW5_9BURK|nr:hypothetical protein [Roseateles oligotrophus]MCV2371055.1 hypothetical protein [Roseateles oligotrophus]